MICIARKPDQGIDISSANNLIRRDSHSAFLYLQDITQSPRVHDLDWVSDRDLDLFVDRRHLLVDETVRQALIRVGLVRKCPEKGDFKPFVVKARLLIRRELYQSLISDDRFLRDIDLAEQALEIPGLRPEVLTFKQYQRFYDWSRNNDNKRHGMYESFQTHRELVRTQDGFAVAGIVSGNPKLEAFEFSHDKPVYFRLAAVRE